MAGSRSEELYTKGLTMGRFEVRKTTQLDVTPERAWDYVMSHDEWRLPYVTAVTKLTEGDTAVGSRFENSLKGGGRTWTVINEITHVEPPRRLTWKQVNEDGPTITIEGNYLIEPAEGGSTFTMHNIFETTGRAAGPTWFNKWILERMAYPRFFKQLREAVRE